MAHRGRHPVLCMIDILGAYACEYVQRETNRTAGA
jgi:hypothetical protein